jgi:hypothetical protein
MWINFHLQNTFYLLQFFIINEAGNAGRGTNKKILGDFLRLKMKIGWMIPFCSILTSIIMPISLTTAYIGIDQTIISFAFPNSFIKKNFNSSQPWIEYSFFIKNYNRGELDLELKITIEAKYYRELINQIFQQKIFNLNGAYRKISYGQSLSKLVNASYTHFDLLNLQYFWDNGNFSKPFSFLMSEELEGNYHLSFISFEIIFYDLNVSDYEF